MAPALLNFRGMNQTARLQKLRQRQARLDEELRAAQEAVDNQRQKNLHRTKLILGGVFLAVLGAEREALLSMVLHHLDERQRRFVTEQLAGSKSPDAPPAAGLN